MRIRKRFLSLSAAITAPPSSSTTDLQTGDHRQLPLTLVQHQQLHPNANPHVLYDNTPSQFSDAPNHRHLPTPPSSAAHNTQIGLQPSISASSGAAGSDENKIKEVESERKKEIIKTADLGRRNESILYTEASSHDLVVKGWLEGDMLIPIKKRRGSFEKRMKQQDNEMMLGGPMKPKPKNDDDDGIKNKKNEKRGNVIMEGSRCSRVNGRGWRCSQQTLIGYSLCEHHLGKGRLRSMTNVRGRARNIESKKLETKESQEATSIDPHLEFEDDDDDYEEEFKDWEVESVSSKKIVSKRTKLGVVKARSLSSLLSQIGS